MNYTFSIIIPFQHINPYVIDCINFCLALEYNKYDIILLPDFTLSREELLGKLGKNVNKKEFSERVKIIPTGPIKPGAKRNIGMKKSKAKYFACIDSDAYPPKDWLKNSVEFLKYNEVGIVGGPNKTPAKVEYLEKLAIKVLYLNVMAKGLYFSKRFKNKAIEYSVMASSNLIIKKSVVEESGYFDEEYYPGEDAVLSYHVLDKGYKILYAPNVVVYHHRRPLFWRHLKKMKETAECTSSVLTKFKKHRSILHFLPSVFFLYILIGSILSFFHIGFLFLFATTMTIYFIIILFDSIISKTYNPFDIIIVTLGAFLTHLFYGYGFLKGIIFPDLCCKDT